MHNHQLQARVGRNLRSSKVTAAPRSPAVITCSESGIANVLTRENRMTKISRNNGRLITIAAEGQGNMMSGKRSLPWIIALSLGSAVAGCTAGDDTGDHVEEEGQAVTASAALFLNTSTVFGSTVDWDFEHGKAECAPGEAIVGISEIPGGPGRTALCLASTAALSPGAVTATLLLSGADQRLAQRQGDWSLGFYKLECAIGQYVSAVSENAMQNQGNNNFHGIQCAQGSGLGANETCTTRIFDAGDSRGATSSGDWDPGAYKGECGTGAYVVGVSSSPSTGAPHAILCCGSEVAP